MVAVKREGFVYVAGPYRHGGTHDYTVYEQIDHNIAIARTWSMNLAREGIPYFCPHLNSWHGEVIAPEVDPDFWLEMDLQILPHATALLLLPNWSRSEGAKIEAHTAFEKEIPVFTTDAFSALTLYMNDASITWKEVEEQHAVFNSGEEGSPRLPFDFADDSRARGTYLPLNEGSPVLSGN